MKRVMVAGIVVFLLLPLLLAASQESTFDDVVQALETDGFFVEAGAEAVDTGRLAAIVGDSSVDLRPVILAGAAVDGEEQLAHDILDDIGTGTVVVISPSDIGVSTDRADDAEVEAAFDRADAEADSLADLVGYLEVFDQALVDPRAGAAGGGVSVGTIVLIGLLVLGGLVLFNQIRTRRAAAAARRRAVEEAQQEVSSQISALADRIFALHDEVELAGKEEVSRLYTAATGTYSAAQDHLKQSSTAEELERVSGELDHARWQLESVSALLEDREPPPEPEKEVACFFDPNHGAGTQQAKLNTVAGQKDVRVCGSCASKLAAGEAPEPRMIEVAGQRVPAAKAPRSYGGGGYDDLGNFTVVMGGHRHPYGWGGYHGWGVPRRRRSWFGGWGWGGPWGGGDTPRRRRWTGSGSWSTGGSWSPSRRGGVRRSRSFSRGGMSRSRSVSRGGMSRSRSVSRGRGRRSRGGGSRSRGGGSRRR